MFLTATIYSYADNYDFSAVYSMGQTLYYNITSDSAVRVTFPNSHFVDYNTPVIYYYNYQEPVGELLIPEVTSPLLILCYIDWFICLSGVF